LTVQARRLRPPPLLAGLVKEGLTVPRLTYLTGLAVILVGGALALTHALLGPWPGVTEANARRVRAGMTVEQVEALLGAPAEKVGRRPWFGGGWEKEAWRFWQGSRVSVLIEFDKDGRARKAIRPWTNPPAQTQAPLGRLRAWLGW